MIASIDLPTQYEELQHDLDDAYHRVARRGQFICYEECEAFEAEFAAYCQVTYCSGVGNGLEAIELILRAYGIGAGDEVIVPSNTFIATWLAVSHTGARPVPVDPDADFYNVDPQRVEPAITDRTKAIIPVHLYGQPADADAIMDIAARYGLLVVDDAAQAHGARYKGRPVGSLSHAAAFSFYPTKNLGALGDGGAVVTSDGHLAERVRMLRNYGASAKYVHSIRGFNSRLDELQAALLRVKLRKLDDWNQRRREVASRYRDALQGIPGLVLPSVPEWAEPVWHQFVIRHPRRDAIQRHLAEQGIASLVHYPIPPHESDAYAGEGWGDSQCGIAHSLSREVLSLPIGPHMSAASVDAVAAALREFLRA
jgi:dTDP-4-amino-4,6-dideoxygalactose transaminase